MRVLSIISLVIVALTLIVTLTYVYDTTYEWADATAGWAIILSLYVIAQNVVTIVQTKK